MAKKKKKSDAGDWAVGLFAIMLLTIASQAMPPASSDSTSVRDDTAKAKTSLVQAMTPEEAIIDDGDTVQLKGLEQDPPVRLLQINAPEIDQCYGEKAKDQLEKMVKDSADVHLRYDSKLPRVRYERTLGYVYADGENLNIKLVRNGFATRYFIKGERGDYAKKIQKAEDSARAHKRGIWGVCSKASIPARW